MSDATMEGLALHDSEAVGEVGVEAKTNDGLFRGLNLHFDIDEEFRLDSSSDRAGRVDGGDCDAVLGFRRDVRSGRRR
jgi:hypothetical protein